jgi:allantoinase
MHWERHWRGAVDMVATDHSPCLPEMKQFGNGSFLTAWGGISSLWCSLPAVWQKASTQGIGLEKLVEWMCLAPRGWLAWMAAKARSHPDMMPIWSCLMINQRGVSMPEAWFSRNPFSPYVGRALKDRVLAIFLRVHKVYGDGRHSVFPDPVQGLRRPIFIPPAAAVPCASASAGRSRLAARSTRLACAVGCARGTAPDHRCVPGVQ